MFREYLRTSAHVQRTAGFIKDPSTGIATAESLEAAYGRWISHVQSVVPAERLLLHTATEGYEPLCTFLGVPVPKEGYPRVNDSADLRRQIDMLKAIADWWPIVTALLAFLGLGFMLIELGIWWTKPTARGKMQKKKKRE